MMILSLGGKKIRKKSLRKIAFYKHARIAIYLEINTTPSLPPKIEATQLLSHYQ